MSMFVEMRDGLFIVWAWGGANARSWQHCVWQGPRYVIEVRIASVPSDETHSTILRQARPQKYCDGMILSGCTSHELRKQ